MRVVVSIVAGLMFSVFVVLSVSFIVSFVYEDEVSELFLKELNKRVKTDMKADNVNLSLLKRFPNAVVELQLFEMNSAPKEKIANEGGISLSADKVSFQFDVIDLFTGRYNLDQIYIDHAQLHYTIGEGLAKLQVKKPKQEKLKQEKLKMKINKLVFTDLHYSVLSADGDFSVEGHAPKIRLSGEISSEKFNLDVDSRLFIKNFLVDDFPYIHRKNVKLAIHLMVTPSSYRMGSGKLYYEHIPFNVEGSFNRKEKTLDLRLMGQSLDVGKFNLYLPWKIRKKLEPVQINDGRLDFYARLEGPVAGGRPELQADFNLSNGDVVLNHQNSYHLQNISLSGYVSNGRYNSPQSSLLTLKSLHAELNGNELNCNMKLSNFKDPKLSSQGNVIMNLGKLPGKLTSSEYSEFKGSVYVNYTFNGDMESLKHPDRLIQYGQLTGDASFKNVGLKRGNYQFANASGFVFLDRDLYVDSMRMTVNGNDMTVRGTLEDVYRNLADTSLAYQIDLAIESPGVNIDRLFAAEQSNRDSVIHFRFPEKLSGTVQFDTDSMQWNDFHASRMSGRVSLSRNALRMDRLMFYAFGGAARAQGSLEKNNKEDPFFLDVEFHLDRIDIQQVFGIFDDFGQDYMTHKNLRGQLNGEVKLSTKLNNKLEINKKELYTYSDVTINKGELIDFEPLIKMANFVTLSELKHVTFSQLTNKITIDDQRIYIPEMDIHSSAFDITVSGYHDFDNQFSYQVNLLLSQVLSQKAKNNGQFDSEFGNIQDDGVGRTKIFLKIHGNPEKYVIKYDNEGVSKKIKQDLRREKNELKQILHEEFGWFKKDTFTQSKQEQKSERLFGISWEEGNGEKNQKKTSRASEKKEQKRFIIQWENDTLK